MCSLSSTQFTANANADQFLHHTKDGKLDTLLYSHYINMEILPQFSLNNTSERLMTVVVYLLL